MTAIRWRVLLFLVAALSIGVEARGAVENGRSAGQTKDSEKLPNFTRLKRVRLQEGPIQKNACDELVCSLDKPVTQGDLLVVIGAGACDTTTCNTVSDDLANDWQIAEVVPYVGITLWYAIAATDGIDTFHRSFGFWGTIVAEYPAALSLDGANYGTYAVQNIGDAPEGGSADLGHTEPIEVTFPNDLLITWAGSGSGGHNYMAGPFFSLEGVLPNGLIAFEDMIAEKPGLYMGTMGWDTYGHWTMGVAAFRMGALAVQNPSFEDTSGSLIQSSEGPWNYFIPGWWQPPGAGTGVWQPAPGTVSVPDGRTVAWMNGGSVVLQDLGKTPAKTYTLTVSVGIRAGGDPTWTVSLRNGAAVLCATSGNASSTPVGSFAIKTVACHVPAGDITIYFEAEGNGQVLLDDVQLTSSYP
jgi:hypothetical protein